MVWEQLTDYNLKEYVRKDMYADAYSVLGANTAETPVSVAISTNSVLGRLSGNIASLSASDLNSILSAYITLDGAYNNQSGEHLITMDDGDIRFAPTGDYSVVFDLSACTNAADGLFITNGSDNFNLIRENTNTMSLDADLNTIDISAWSTMVIAAAGVSSITVANNPLTIQTTGSNGGAHINIYAHNVIDMDATGLTVDVSQSFSIDGVTGSNVSVTGADLTISTITSGTLYLTAAEDVVISGVGDSGIVIDSGNLVLQTTTTGDVLLDSVDNIGLFALTPSSFVDLEKAGTVTADVDFFEITNTANAAAMTNTRTSILFNQWYYDAATPAVADAAKITVGTETNWDSTAANQDAYMAFCTALDGVVAEKMRISSGGNLGINGLTAWGTNAVGVMGINSGTAPTTSPADAAQIWVADRGATAGKAGLHIRSEDGTSHVLSDRVGINTVTPATLLDQAQWSADALGSTHTFSKSRHATVGSHTIVQDNDVIGGINFCPSDGTDFGTVSAQIRAEVDDAAPGASSIGGRLVWATAIGAGADDITDHMALDKDGILSIAKTIENTTIDIGYAEDGASPPALETVITDTNGSIRVRKFDDASVEDVVIPWRVPDDIVVADGITFKVHGIITEAVAPAAGEGVSFKLSGYSRGTGDSLNGAFGVEVEANITDLDAVGVDAQYDLFSTAYSSTVTITDLAAGELVMLHLERDTADADDDYAQDVGVIGITIKWTRQLPAS